jgi:hypothetical protein
LDDRASAPYGGVRAGCHKAHFLRFDFAVAAQRHGKFCSNETSKVLGNGGEVEQETPGCFSSVLVKHRFWSGQIYWRQS